MFGPKLIMSNSINKSVFFQEETEIDERFEDQNMNWAVALPILWELVRTLLISLKNEARDKFWNKALPNYGIIFNLLCFLSMIFLIRLRKIPTNKYFGWAFTWINQWKDESSNKFAESSSIRISQRPLFSWRNSI